RPHSQRPPPVLKALDFESSASSRACSSSWPRRFSCSVRGSFEGERSGCRNRQRYQLSKKSLRTISVLSTRPRSRHLLPLALSARSVWRITLTPAGTRECRDGLPVPTHGFGNRRCRIERRGCRRQERRDEGAVRRG